MQIIYKQIVHFVRDVGDCHNLNFYWFPLRFRELHHDAIICTIQMIASVYFKKTTVAPARRIPWFPVAIINSGEKKIQNQGNNSGAFPIKRYTNRILPRRQILKMLFL
jgi:hypothetical protein